MDPFGVLAAPARRAILAELQRQPSSVNELVAAVAEAQPSVSKHLKVLREAGFVSCTGAAQQRIYVLEAAPFRELDAWLAPYRRLWERHLDALEQFLDHKEKQDEAKRVPPRPAGRRHRARRR
jgi:DNA-binding transcriptional ArsR family regulator